MLKRFYYYLVPRSDPIEIASIYATSLFETRDMNIKYYNARAIKYSLCGALDEIAINFISPRYIVSRSRDIKWRSRRYIVWLLRVILVILTLYRWMARFCVKLDIVICCRWHNSVSSEDNLSDECCMRESARMHARLCLLLTFQSWDPVLRICAMTLVKIYGYRSNNDDVDSSDEKKHTHTHIYRFYLHRCKQLLWSNNRIREKFWGFSITK